MPRSGWLRELASKVAIPLLFLLIGGLVVGYFIRLGLQEEWASRRDAQTRSEQYAETKQNPEYNGCARLPPIHQKDCFAEANDAGRANQRSERDLVAQETTASWTFITSLAALVGVMLSFIGVGLIWGTFRETRETNAIARKVGEAQARAYLRVAGVENVDIESPQLVADDRGHIVLRHDRVKMTIENTGHSPAMSVTSFITGRLGVIDVGIQRAIGTVHVGLNVVDVEFATTKTELFTYDIRKTGQFLNIVLKYNDIFDKERQFTASQMWQADAGQSKFYQVHAVDDETNQDA